MDNYKEIQIDNFKLPRPNIKDVAQVVETYYDDLGNKVEKQDATRVIISEFDAQNNLINQVYGEIGKKKTR